MCIRASLGILVAFSLLAASEQPSIKIADYQLLTSETEVYIVSISGEPHFAASPTRIGPSVLHIFKVNTNNGNLVSSFRSQWLTPKYTSFVLRDDSLYAFDPTSTELNLVEVTICGVKSLDAVNAVAVFPELADKSVARQLFLLEEISDKCSSGVESIKVARSMLEEFDPLKSYGSDSASADQIKFSWHATVIFVDWDKSQFVLKNSDSQCHVIKVE